MSYRYSYFLEIYGLTKDKQYTLTFDTASKKGYFSLNIE